MHLPNDTLLQGGKYKIKKVLGQGSFGITYLATSKFKSQGALGEIEVEAQVAIKEFFMADINNRNANGSSVDGTSGSICANYKRKFRKEAENLAKLSHPNIVKVYDVFDENQTSYYVMEYVEGNNLDNYIAQHGKISEEKAIGITREIGEALSYMHDHKMLHLDVKPKNVMCRTNGHYCLIDFGLSKQFTDNGEPESSTTIGLGTPGYAPIEQAHFKKYGTFPATLDVYALGATLFKMLTGKRPPEATAILNEGFPATALEKENVHAASIHAIESAMAPICKHRIQSVRQFLEELHANTVQDNTTNDEQTSFNDILDVEVPKSKMSPSLKARMSLQFTNLMNFKGHATRTEFWTAFCVSVPLWIAGFVLDAYLVNELSYTNNKKGEFICVFLGCIWALLPILAVGFRRLNDIGLNKNILWITCSPLIFALLYTITYILNYSRVDKNFSLIFITSIVPALFSLFAYSLPSDFIKNKTEWNTFTLNKIGLVKDSKDKSVGWVINLLFVGLSLFALGFAFSRFSLRNIPDLITSACMLLTISFSVRIMMGKPAYKILPVLILPIVGCILEIVNNRYDLYAYVLLTLFYWLFILCSNFKIGTVVSKSFLRLRDLHPIVQCALILSTVMLLIALPCVFSNVHLEYYCRGFGELLVITYSLYLIWRNRKMGLILPAFVLFVGYWFEIFENNDNMYNWIVEQSITAVYLSLLLLFVFVKRKGKSAWAYMK